MKLEKFLADYFNKHGIPTHTRTGKSFIDSVIYGYRQTGIAAQTYSNFTSRYFPDKPKNIYIRTWVLDSLGYKYCTGCEKVLPQDNFALNNSTKTGLQNYCRVCHYNGQQPNMAYQASVKRARKKQRTPSWANLEAIKDIYLKCPEGYQVDHIIPLNGINVSGLHVEDNLQYLTTKDNLIKSNRY